MSYIKLYRSLLEWSWIDDPNTLALWVHLLLGANWKDGEWHDEEVRRGQMITSISKLAAVTGLSAKQVRTCLDRLVRGGEIVKEGASQWTKITICKYDSYQCDDNDEGQTKGKPSASEGQAEGKQRATIEEGKKERREEDKKEKEGDTDVSPKKETPDFSVVLTMWNDSAKRSVPKVRMLSPARKEKVKLRVKEMGGWDEAMKVLPLCFQKLNDSDFCNGATGKWTATFDWFFENEKNWMKVLEGNYDNRKEKTQLEQLAETIQKGHEYYQRQYGYGGTSAYGVPPGSGPYGPDEQ